MAQLLPAIFGALLGIPFGEVAIPAHRCSSVDGGDPSVQIRMTARSFVVVERGGCDERAPVNVGAREMTSSFGLVSNSTCASKKGAEVEKRLVTRHATKSPDAADENQKRVEDVFQELARTKPDDVSCLVLRLADDSFPHVSFQNHGEDETNSISSTQAFAHFQDGHEGRREGGVDQQTATLVGSYITEIG